MINAEKVKAMTNLAMYEQKEGKKYLPISKFYRSDYVGLALIKNFFLVTITYILILGALGAYYAEYLMENIHKMNLIKIGVYLVAGYIILFLVYSIMTYIQYSVKYYKAKKSIKNYYTALTDLDRIYIRKDIRKDR